MSVTEIPDDGVLDSSISFKREGYLFIKNRIDRLHADLFQTRMLGMPVICMSGREAAGLFYDPKHFRRAGAIPKMIQDTVTGENSIQNLDGKKHRERKRFFLDLASERQQKQISELTMAQWMEAVPEWEKSETVVLFEEARYVLLRTACRWCGMPLCENEVKGRADDFYDILDSLSGMGGRYVKGFAARKRTEEWVRSAVEDTRSGRLNPNTDSALCRIAFFNQYDGSLLDVQTAASELINVLLPTVAVATYVVFSALALQEHPEWKNKLRSGGREEYSLFAQEVRRFYPFAPFLAAKVKDDFTWNGCLFHKDRLVLLDLYGTDHDPRIWQDSNEFRPERFRERETGPYDLVATGGGSVLEGHRSPGEPIAARIMEVSLDFLVNRIDYETPLQDFGFRMDRMPTFPNSGFLMSKVRQRDPPQDS